MGWRGRAQHGAPLRESRRPFVRAELLGAMLLTVTLLAAVSAAGAREEGRPAQLRLVLSSLGQQGSVRALSTRSLYAENDRWKAYLAAESTCPGGERTDLSAERQVATVVCLINYARQRRGLRELVVGPLLNSGSVRKARAIVRCVNFAHNPCGGDWTSAVRSTGYKGAFGENLYLASGRWGAPRVAVDAWLNSAAHRRNLFGPNWREQGIAVLSAASLGEHRKVSLWVSVLGDG